MKFKLSTLKQITKILVLTLTLSFSLWNCQKDDEISQKEIRTENVKGNISFSELKKRIGHTSAFTKSFNLFQEQSLQSKSSQTRTKQVFVLDEETVLMIADKDYIDYTLKLIDTEDSSSSFFYNLIFHQNQITGDVTFKIIKYTPSEKWLEHQHEPYSGYVKLISADTIENNTKTSKGLSSKTINKECINSISGGWRCNLGKPHSPADCRSDSNPNGKCWACGAEYIVKITYGECDETVKEVPLDDGDGGSFFDGNKESNNDTNRPIENTDTSNVISNTQPLVPCKGEVDINGNCINSNALDVVNDINVLLDFGLTALEKDWLNKNFFKAEKILVFLRGNSNSTEAKTEAKMRIIAEMVNDSDSSTLQWDFSKKGTYLNRPALKFKATADVPGKVGSEKMYLLENDLVLYTSNSPKQINKPEPGTIASTEYNSENYHYIYSNDTKRYYEYRLPPEDFVDADIDFLFDAFWTGTKFAARYATPIEDIIILIDGEDFDGVEQSKVQTAGFMIVGFIPGGKALKPVSKGLGKVWKVVIKNGDKVFTRTVRELTQETIEHFDHYTEGAKDLLQEALRKGEILDDEIIIEVGQEIADLSEKKGRKLKWPEVKALFKRGNDFNKKGRLRYGDDNVEIVLADGKRLDTYIDGERILSRKATDIDNIKESTWRNYCNELVTKYKAGKLTNSRKLGDASDQVQLSGKYYLEIPASNQNASSLERFKQIASEYGTENQPEGIIITFLTE